MTKELTLALIFLLTHYVCPVTEAQVVTFPRCNSDKLTLEFVYANPAHDPYDLFASTRKSTCGKRAATINGSGSYADPYVISVDLSRGLMAQTPDCGVVQTGPNRFRLTVRAVFSCEAPTVNDTDYTAECDLTLPTPTTDTPASAPWASYTCRAPSTIVFTVYHAAATPPFDIYAVGKELTCSLSGGQGTGTGTEADPFTLHIDVSDTVNNCGVTTNGTDTYSVVMYVQKLADIITSADTAYALTCNFTSLSNQIISSATQPVSSNIPVGVASQNQPSASLFVLSSSPSSSAAAVLSSFAVGDPIRLAANLLDGPASGLRVRQCTASPGPGLTPRLPILDDTGCSSGNGLVPPFVVQGPSGAQAVTDSFQAFKFTSYDTIFFQCVADFCYGDNDLACLGSHCHNKRRKRGTDLVTSDAFASSVITAYVTVRSDVPANLTGFTKSGSQQDNSVCWTRNYIVAIASLAPICAAFVLLSIALGIRIVSMTTRGSNNLDSHAHLAKSEASTLASRESWHGGIILQYRPPALSAH